MQIQKYFTAILLLTIIVVMTNACKDDNPNNSNAYIPNVPVNFYISPNTIDFIPAGGWKYYDNEGYRGIIVYRIDQYNFMAYERTCPYDPQKDCAQVEVDQSTYTLIDSCCMSRFNIIDGSPVSGPSTYPLKYYFTEFDGNLLHIYNGN
ncbi:MAG TPA: hypothetical protein PK904_11210 [Bacteroidales bacterium]|nr:hypothetical protein [Bacteroidales bacterium]HPE56961.1 hypothetical protein [Bacteroidales bacterium]